MTGRATLTDPHPEGPGSPSARHRALALVAGLLCALGIVTAAVHVGSAVRVGRLHAGPVLTVLDTHVSPRTDQPAAVVSVLRTALPSHPPVTRAGRTPSVAPRDGDTVRTRGPPAG